MNHSIKRRASIQSISPQKTSRDEENQARSGIEEVSRAYGAEEACQAVDHAKSPCILKGRNKIVLSPIFD